MDEVATEGGAVEIGSALWQKLFVAPVVLFCCGLGVVGAVGAFCPQLVEHRSDRLPGVWERLLFLFIGGPMFFGAGLYMSQVWFYRLRADVYGLTESLGYKETRVFWSDVDSFTMEPGRSRTYGYEPIFRDASGAIIFRPAEQVLVSDASLLRRRDAFWSLVQSHLEGKQKSYTPPTPIPNPYEGKSTAWKIKRVATLALGLLTCVGLWSAAMLWAIAHPELPNWVLPTIGFAALLAPYTVGLPLALAEKRRQKKLRAESDAAST